MPPLLLRRVTTQLVMMLVMALLVSSILAACGSSSGHLLSPDEIASYVGTYYGEPHPQILDVKSDVADPPPHEPLYLMALTGHFKKGTLEASKLSFSATASRRYVWDISAHDEAGNEVWFDRYLGYQDSALRLDGLPMLSQSQTFRAASL